MLWDVVYDFFVQYVFGGYTTEGAYVDSVFFGNAWIGEETSGQIYGYDILIPSGFKLAGWEDTLYLPLPNYLSLIATIISMIIIVVIACLFIKKIYNMVAHIIA